MLGTPGVPPAAAANARVIIDRQIRNMVRLIDDLLDVARITQGKPSVVFLDIGMPGMDGYEVARRLRRVPGGEHALLIAVTGFGRDEDRQRSKEAGFDRHVTKPLDPRSLPTLIQRSDDGGVT
jgi:CheY-like chemotaxis protein